MSLSLEQGTIRTFLTNILGLRVTPRIEGMNGLASYVNDWKVKDVRHLEVEQDRAAKDNNVMFWEDVLLDLNTAFKTEVELRMTQERANTDFFVAMRKFLLLLIKDVRIALFEEQGIKMIVHRVLGLIEEEAAYRLGLRQNYLAVLEALLASDVYRPFFKLSYIFKTIDSLFKLMNGEFGGGGSEQISARAINTVLTHCPIYWKFESFQILHVLDQFQSYFSNSMVEKGKDVKRQVLSAYNILLERTGVNYMDKIREISNSFHLIRVWKSKSNDDQFRMEILRFYEIMHKLKFDKEEIPFENLHLDALLENVRICFRSRVFDFSMYAESGMDRIEKYCEFVSWIVYYASLREKRRTCNNTTSNMEEQTPKKKRKTQTIVSEIIDSINEAANNPQNVNYWPKVLFYLFRDFKSQVEFNDIGLVQSLCALFDKTTVPIVQRSCMLALNEVFKSEHRRIFRNLKFAEQIWNRVRRFFRVEDKSLIKTSFKLLATLAKEVRNRSLILDDIINSNFLQSEFVEGTLHFLNELLIRNEDNRAFPKKQFIVPTHKLIESKEVDLNLISTVILNIFKDGVCISFISRNPERLDLLDCLSSPFVSIVNQIQKCRNDKTRTYSFEDISSHQFDSVCLSHFREAILQQFCGNDKKITSKDLSLFRSSIFFLNVWNSLRFAVNIDEEFKSSLKECCDKHLKEVVRFVKKTKSRSERWLEFILDNLNVIVQKIGPSFGDSFVSFVWKKMREILDRIVSDTDESFDKFSQDSDFFLEEVEEAFTFDKEETVCKKVLRVLTTIGTKSEFPPQFNTETNDLLSNKLSKQCSFSISLIICKYLIKLKNGDSFKHIFKFLRNDESKVKYRSKTQNRNKRKVLKLIGEMFLFLSENSSSNINVFGEVISGCSKILTYFVEEDEYLYCNRRTLLELCQTISFFFKVKNGELDENEMDEKDDFDQKKIEKRREASLSLLLYCGIGGPQKENMDFFPTDYIVRLCFSQQVKNILKSSTEINEIYTHLTHDKLIGSKSRSIYERSSTVGISYFAAYCDNESFAMGCIYKLVVLFSSSDGERNVLFDRALEFVSSIRGYDDVENMLMECFPILCFKWVQEKNISDFPYERVFVRCSSISEFYEKMGGVILPFLLFSKDELCKEMLKEFMQSLGTLIGKETKVYETYFPYIVAQCLLEDSNSDTTHFDRLENLLTGLNLRDNIMKNMARILVCILERCCFSDKCTEIYFSRKAVLAAISKISKKFFSSNRGKELFFKKKITLLDVIIQFHVRIHESVFNRRRLIKVVNWVIEDFIGHDDGSLQQDYYQRSLFHLAVHNLDLKDALNESIAFLRTVIKVVQMGGEQCEEEFTKFFKVLKNKLVEIVDDSNCSDFVRKSCFSVLDSLFFDDRWKVLRKSVERIGGFPCDEGKSNHFSKYQKVYEKMLSNSRRTLGREMEMFLKEKLLYKLPIIANLLKDNDLLSDPQICQRLVYLRQFNVELIKLSTSQNVDRNTKEMCKKCLIHLGLSSLIFSKKDLIEKEYEFETYGKYFGDRKTKCSTFVDHVVGSNVVPFLTECLLDKDVVTIKLVKDLLCHLFISKKIDYRRKCANWKSYLDPFIELGKPSRQKSQVFLLGRDSIKETFRSEELWGITNHNEWVRKVTFSLLRDRVLQNSSLSCMSSVCLRNCEFAEMIFPLAIYYALVNNTNKKMSKELKSWKKSIVKRITDIFLVEDSNPRTVKLLLSTLLILKKRVRKYYLKRTPKFDDMTKHVHECLLPVEYLDIVNAAIRVNCHITALAFIDSYLENDGILELLQQELIIDDESAKYQKYLIEIYKNIKDRDGLHGVNNIFGDRAKRLEYEYEENWVGLSEVSDSEMMSGVSDKKKEGLFLTKVDSFVNLLDSLKHMNLRFSVFSFVDSVPKNFLESSRKLQEKFYEIHWRLNLSPKYLPVNSHGGFNESVYKCLLLMKQKNEEKFFRMMESAQKRINLQSSVELSNVIIKLQMLSDIEECFQIRLKRNSSIMSDSSGMNDVDETPTISFLKYDYSSCDLSFTELEPLFALRINLLEILEMKNEKNGLICKMLDHCRKNGRLDVAVSLMQCFSNSSHEFLFEEAKIHWKKKDKQDYARKLLFLIEKRKGIPNHLKGKIFLKLGTWNGKEKLKETYEIENYFKKSLSFSGDKCKCYFKFAEFYDRMYLGVSLLQESKEWESEETTISETQKQLKLLKSKINGMKERDPQKRSKLRNSNRLEKKILHVKNKHDEVRRMYKDFAGKSIMKYIKTISNGSKYDVSSVYRIISIWFNDYGDKEIQKIINISLFRNDAPNIWHKFIPLVFQIVSRLGSSEVVEKLVKNVAVNHPHHCLYQIFAIRNGDEDVHKMRIESAKRVLTSLCTYSDTRKIVEEMNYLIKSYIHLAKRGVTKRENDQKKGKFSGGLAKIRNYRKCPITTASVPIRSNGEYSDLEYISHFNNFFHLCGGANLPKKVKCFGSRNTKPYIQLVKGPGKGKDDHRQDAIMEQFFGLVNVLLKRTPETRKKHLNVRQYNVVPLCPQTGVLEWCEGTIPIREYLCSANVKWEKTAVFRYHPEGITNYQAQHAFASGMKKKDRTYYQISAKDSLRSFKKATSNFKPVLHHFFWENGEDPVEWFEKKMCYTKSVATNSMVGYVVGLGDRHLNNILIDKSNAEVVHIDLGVSFDQGKLLRIPELVPFRLTQNVVDGFGIAGIEGVFRRCCESTMRVLRENIGLLMTVVEVFLHDPLHKWFLTQKDIMNLQRDDAEQDGDPMDMDIDEDDDLLTVNKDARLCIVKVREKLNGFEENEFLSVEGQVNRLISQAMDIRNLSRMFIGWAPWL